MCVLIDVALNGLFRSHNVLRLVNPDNAEISDTWLYSRFNHVSLVNPDNAAISEIWLS